MKTKRKSKWEKKPNYNEYGRRISCIFIDGDEPCAEETVYTVDVFSKPDDNGDVTMPLIDFECCQTHYEWSKCDDNDYILKNVERKMK